MVRKVLKLKTDNGLGANNPSFKNIELTEYTFNPKRMGFPDFTATLMWPTCLDDEWSGREYVEFWGEKHYIRHTPTSEKNNTDARFKHNLVFTSESAEILGNVYFYDAVYNNSLTKDKPCSNSPNVKFYGDIFELCDRINSALRFRGLGDSILEKGTNLTTEDKPAGDGFCIMVDESGDFDHQKSWEFTFEDKTIWEVISDGFSTTEIPFEKRGKCIIFGATPKTVNQVFEYGFDNELLSIKHNNANAKVINRITMLGSTENIPYYYPNATEYGNISIDTTGNTHLLASDITIENTAQMLAVIPNNTRATLAFAPLSEAIPIDGIRTSFEGNDYEPYELKAILKHDHNPNGGVWAPWNILIAFTVTEKKRYALTDILGRTWYSNVGGNKSDIDGSLTQGVLSAELKKYSGSSWTSTPLQVDESGVDMGSLSPGQYELTFHINILNSRGAISNGVVAYVAVDKVEIKTSSRTADGSGYYWKVGSKEYLTGGLGLSIDKTLTDDMVGETIGWKASGRLDFQKNLMPPKYLETKGAERFYEAISNTYTDPDTNQKYVFPNPYIEGAPVEHIYRNEDIKPTITGVKNSDNLLLGVIADIAFDENDNDALKQESQNDSDKNDSLKYEHSYFYIRLNRFDGEYGFNLFAHASQTDPMTIQMTSGPCNGCKFKIQVVEFEDENGLKSVKNPVQMTSESGTIVDGDYKDKISDKNFQAWQQDTSQYSVWICVQKDAETFGQILPSKIHDYLPEVGNTFNIINIDLPDPYIRAAEKRLEEEGIRYMFDNNVEKFNFEISASRTFFAEHPEVLAAIDEYSKLKIKYNGVIYEQYIDSLSIKYSNNEALPDIGITLSEQITASKGFTESVAERASSLIANPYTLGGTTGGNASGGLNLSFADNRYLNKQSADRSQYKIASNSGFDVGEFVAGTQGGTFYIDPSTGRSYLEVDQLCVRLKAMFEELEVAKLQSIGGELGVSPGGSIQISYVDDSGSAYRCYFKGKEDERGASCRFVVGDLVQCKESNITAGLSQNASNRYYWRFVTAVNNDLSYFDLSKTDYDKLSNDTPKPGDTVMQLGNRFDSSRQSAVLISTTNSKAPSVTLYNGINNYSLEDKGVVEYGVDKTKATPEPFLHCYGSFFYGPRSRNTYIEYDATTGEMIFKGKLTVDSHIGDNSVTEFVNNTISPSLETIQSQVDDKIECYYQDTNPAAQWSGLEEKAKHEGDLWYNTKSHILYRYDRVLDANNNIIGYSWRPLKDATAENALSIANGKMQVFVSTPSGPYSVGDLWLRSWKDTDGVQRKDLYRCAYARSTGYDFNDWVEATFYDNTQVVIDNGIVTAGTVQLANGNSQSIVAGITGGESESATESEERKVRIWAGASKANRFNAPFRVMQDGSFVATSARIEGDIIVSGIIMPKKTVITALNYKQYTEVHSGQRVISTGKLTGHVVLDSSLNSLITAGTLIPRIFMVGTGGAVVGLTGFTVEDFVGSRMRIVNNTNSKVEVTGNILWNIDELPSSMVLSAGHECYMTCYIKFRNNQKEIGWLVEYQNVQ